MATVNTPKSFTLINQGDSVITEELLSSAQGIYLTFVPGGLTPSAYNDWYTIGFKAENPAFDLFLTFYTMTNGISVFTRNTFTLSPGGDVNINGDDALLREFAIGDTVSMYLDSTQLNVYLNGTLVYTEYLTSGTSPSYRFTAKFDVNRTRLPINITNILYYPTGLPGLDGASQSTLTSSINPNHILTPTSYRFTTSYEVMQSIESYEADTNGIYCQFMPSSFEFSDNTETYSLGIISSTGTKYIINFYRIYIPNVNSHSYSCSSGIQPISGSNISGYYLPLEDVFQIYNDSSNVFFYKNGRLIAQSTHVPGVTYKLYGTITPTIPSDPLTHGPYDITNIRFYPTGKIGPSGGPVGPTGPTGPVSGITNPANVSLDMNSNDIIGVNVLDARAIAVRNTDSDNTATIRYQYGSISGQEELTVSTPFTVGNGLRITNNTGDRNALTPLYFVDADNNEHGFYFTRNWIGSGNSAIVLNNTVLAGSAFPAGTNNGMGNISDVANTIPQGYFDGAGLPHLVDETPITNESYTVIISNIGNADSLNFQFTHLSQRDSGRFHINGYIKLQVQDTLYVYPEFSYLRNHEDESISGGILFNSQTPFMISTDSTGYGTFSISDITSFPGMDFENTRTNFYLYAKSQSASNIAVDGKFVFTYQPQYSY